MKLDLHCGKMTQFQSFNTWIPAQQIFRGALEAERDKAQMQPLAVIVAAMGDAAAATSSLRASNVEIQVKAVEFRMGDELFRGLLSDCPFDETDEVEVVSEWRQSEGFHDVKAIARPADRLIAMCESCVRGRIAYFRRARKRWGIVSVLVAVAAWYLVSLGGVSESAGWLYAVAATLGISALYAFIERRIYVENYRPLAYLTEDVLSLLGMENAQTADLIQMSKATRTGQEPVGYRWSFFRY